MGSWADGVRVAQVDNALTSAHSVLFPKGLDTAVATSRQQHAANVEAANEAREAYLKKACLSVGHCPITLWPNSDVCGAVSSNELRYLYNSLVNSWFW